MCEGLVRDFLADTDVQGYWKTRVYKGPFSGDDSQIVVPQIVVLPAPGAAEVEPGVSGVNNTIVTVIVGSFEKHRTGPLTSGAGTYDEYDRLQKLKRIILAGTGSVNPGKILDPDASGTAPLDYLNVTQPIFDDRAPVLVRPGVVLWSFLAIFQTKINNSTFARSA